MADYSFNQLPERAEAAKVAYREYVSGLERDYENRTAVRKAIGMPAVAILGMGRSGKDTAGDFLCERFALTKPKSSSLNALPLVAHMIGIPDEQAYRERHDHRDFWIRACDAIRDEDLTLLAKMCLGQCDMAIGLRGADEFATVVHRKVVDLTVWINKPDVPADPTVEFSRDDCDVVIDNTSTLASFYLRLEAFGRVLYGPRRNPETVS